MKVIVLSKGKLVFQGEPLEAIEYYTKTMHSEVFREAKQNKEAVLIEETEEDDDISVTELTEKVLVKMQELAKNLPDQTMAQGLLNLSDEVIEKL